MKWSMNANDAVSLAVCQFVLSAIVENSKTKGGDIYAKTHFAHCQATDQRLFHAGRRQRWAEKCADSGHYPQ